MILLVKSVKYNKQSIRLMMRRATDGLYTALTRKSPVSVVPAVSFKSSQPCYGNHVVKIAEHAVYCDSELPPDDEHFKDFDDETNEINVSYTTKPKYNGVATTLVSNKEKINGSVGSQYALSSKVRTKVENPQRDLIFFEEETKRLEKYKDVLDPLREKAARELKPTLKLGKKEDTNIPKD